MQSQCRKPRLPAVRNSVKDVDYPRTLHGRLAHEMLQGVALVNTREQGVLARSLMRGYAPLSTVIYYYLAPLGFSGEESRSNTRTPLLPYSYHPVPPPNLHSRRLKSRHDLVSTIHSRRAPFFCRCYGFILM